MKNQLILAKLLKFNQQNEQGLSLTETLVAMLISSIVVAMLSPVFLLSMASRLQSFRAKQATEVAQSEIDRVQTLMAQGVKQDATVGVLPPVTTNFSLVNPPTTTVTDRNSLTKDNALEIDYDNDGVKDYFVQLFRDEGVVFDSGLAKDEVAFFRMGVRVYSIASKDKLGALDSSGKVASISFTNLEEQTEKPLAILYTEVIRGDSKLSLLKYKEYLETITSP